MSTCLEILKKNLDMYMCVKNFLWQCNPRDLAKQIILLKERFLMKKISFIIKKKYFFNKKKFQKLKN